MIYITFLNIAIFQGIILGIIILKSKWFNTRSNKYLAYLIFVLSLLLLNLALELGGVYDHFPAFRFIDDIETTFLVPVFLMFFVLNKGDHPLKNSKKLAWLFLPFGYSALINLFNNFDTVAGLYTIPETIRSILDMLYTIELFLALIFYPIVLISIYPFLKYIKQERGRPWITILWILVSLILFSWVIAVLVHLFFAYDISSTMKIIALATTLFIHWTTYVGLYKFKLLGDRVEIKVLLNGQSIKISGNAKVQTFPNGEEKFSSNNIHFKKLERLFREQKIYTDTRLNREQVAKELQISPGYLSQIINTVTGDNFSSYLNRYRVKSVKEMLLNSEFNDYSLLAIGLESGFTSKTTFYKVFKKYTGMTPSQYRKANK